MKNILLMIVAILALVGLGFSQAVVGTGNEVTFIFNANEALRCKPVNKAYGSDTNCVDQDFRIKTGSAEQIASIDVCGQIAGLRKDKGELDQGLSWTDPSLRVKLDYNSATGSWSGKKVLPFVSQRPKPLDDGEATYPYPGVYEYKYRIVLKNGTVVWTRDPKQFECSNDLWSDAKKYGNSVLRLNQP